MMHDNQGFTLIEIIASLVIVGIVAVVAGAGIVAGTRGYLFTRENTEVSQKSQMAMTRMNREMLELTNVSAVSGTPVSSITYTNSTGSNHTLALDAATSTLLLDTKPLVDDVADFNLELYKDDGSGGAQAWVLGSDSIQALSTIRINLALNHTDASAGSSSFSVVVSPRNNRSNGGAVVPGGSSGGAAPGPIGGCFVATAAFGDADHPMVLILREFRDQVLLRFSWGRAGVDLYYAHGPVAAGWIQDREWACRASRLLLYPVAGCAYWAVHQPVVLVGMLLLCILMFRITLKTLRRRQLVLSTPLANSRGGVLIGLIVTMVIFSVLAAGMYFMTGTSAMNQVAANSSTKAYYLAESGFRYAASQYMHAPAATKNQVLQSLNAAAFTLSDTNEQFSIEVYPYFYATSRLHSAGETTLQTYAPGKPTPAPPNSGTLNIAWNFYNYTSYADGTFQGLTPALPEDIPQHTSVLPVTHPVSTQISNGGSLTVDNASFFPDKNGTFQIEGDTHTYLYEERSGNVLSNVRDADDPTRTFTVALDSGDRLTLLAFAKVHAFGTSGGGMATTREVVYYAPIGLVMASDPGAQTYNDTMDSLDRWGNSMDGGYAISSDGGGNAMRVAGTETFATHYKANAGGLKWDDDYANLDSAWRNNDYYLSYDCQVKVKVANPNAYMAGINVRMDVPDDVAEHASTLGGAFQKGQHDYNALFLSDGDDVPDRLIPSAAQNQPLVVLWEKKPGDLSTFNWLAYTVLNISDHNIPQAVFMDDMESGTANWSADAPWSLQTDGDTTVWHDSPGGNYATNVNVNLTSQAMDLSHVSGGYLTFRQKYFIDPGDRKFFIVFYWDPEPDRAMVQISTNGGSSWTTLNTYDGNQSSWQTATFDISSYLPSSNFKVRFRLESNGSDTLDGWYIDDVAIRDKHPSYDTLLVRLEERTTDGDEIFPNRRVNELKVYVGSTESSGTPDGSPLDADRQANPRWPDGSSDTSVVHWPPAAGEDRTPANDYFTLLEGWTVNSSFSGSVAAVSDEDLESGATNAILRLTSFTSPTSGTFSKQEIGLHAFGNSATNVYFDDFAIQLDSPGITSGFKGAIQE